MDESLSLMLKRSEQMAADLSALFQDGLQPEFPRTLLTIAMCQVAMEHAESQRVLIRAGCDVTALSLVRLQFEALVRAIWLHHGATDEWIAGFSAPMEPTQLAEPIGSPPVDSMLQKLDSTAPPPIVKMLRDFKTSTWAPMNSYVHGGVRAVVQSLAGCKPSQLISVLLNANGMALLTANVFVVSCKDSRLSGRIARIRTAYLDCLPPVNPT